MPSVRSHSAKYISKTVNQGKKKKKMKTFSTALLIVCLFLAAASGLFVSAQSAVNPGAAGSTTSLTGIITTVSIHTTNTNGAGKVYPYFSTAAQLNTLGSAGDYCLVSRTTGTTRYNIIWNFTSTESDTIRTWLGGLPQRNNIEVSFTATWDANGRFAVNPTAWTLTQPSLFPYGISDTCNATSMIACLVTLENSLPGDCQNSIIPLVKRCAIDQPQCLAMYGKTLLLVHSYCTQQRGVIDTLFCTDGKAGGDAACAFVNDARPSGVFSSTLVMTVDASGNPTSGSNGQATPPPPPASAGAVMTSLMVAVVVIVSMMM